MYTIKVTNKINVPDIKDTFEYGTNENIHVIWKRLFGHIRNCMNAKVGTRFIVRDYYTGDTILWAYVRIRKDGSNEMIFSW